MNTTSASAIARASDGAGSNVWLFVPSGTMPVTVTSSPPMFWTMFVIGDTVVTTWTGAVVGRLRRRNREQPGRQDGRGQGFREPPEGHTHAYRLSDTCKGVQLAGLTGQNRGVSV